VSSQQLRVRLVRATQGNQSQTEPKRANGDLPLDLGHQETGSVLNGLLKDLNGTSGGRTVGGRVVVGVKLHKGLLKLPEGRRVRVGGLKGLSVPMWDKVSQSTHTEAILPKVVAVLAPKGKGLRL
jgi:hypothetical protein